MSDSTQIIDWFSIWNLWDKYGKNSVAYRKYREENGEEWTPLDYDYTGVEFISKEIKSYEFIENWTVVIKTRSNFESSPNTKNRLGVTTIY